MNRQTTVTIIREFLALPAETLPGAIFLHEDDDRSAWPHLRDYVRPDTQQRLSHLGDRVRLQADSPKFSDGIIVTLQ